MKRFLSLLLAAMMLCAAVPALGESAQRNSLGSLFHNKAAAELRYDGLYCYDEVFNGMDFVFVLRFFEDGTVISTSMLGSTASGTFPTASRMEKGAGGTDNPDDTYTLEGDLLSFTDATVTGTVDYTGTVEQDRLVMYSHSNINDYEHFNSVYNFFPFSEIPGWGDDQPAPQQAAQPRYDGLYTYTAESGMLYVLRFFEDGTVGYNFFPSGSSQIADGYPMPQYVSREGMLNSSSNDAVTLNGDQISFTTNTSSGSVDYAGTVLESGLSLDWHSNINGHDGHEDYAFTPFSDIPGMGGQSQGAPQPQADAQVRTDGVYIFTNESNDLYVMRFFEGGQVGYTFFNTGDPERNGNYPKADAVDRDDMINNGNDQITLNGSDISFTITSSAGTVDYHGTVESDRLVLNSHSNINGFERNDANYIFCSLAELGGQAQGGSVQPEPQPEPQPQPANNGLRFDGLYCLDEEYNGSMFSYVLRFYEDGTVICTSIMGEAAKGDFPKATRMVKNGSDSDPDDTYALQGSMIAFTNTSGTGTVEHWGTVESDRLVLNTHSNINGSERVNAPYIFYPFSGIDGYPADGAAGGQSAPQPQQSANAQLRYDGLYACDYGNYSYMFRFFEDGTVICYTQGSGFARDGVFPSYSKLEKNANLPYDPDDTYVIEGDHITLSDTFENGSVDYEGTIKADRLTLNSHSNVNGNERKNADYIFYPATQIPGWPASESRQSVQLRYDGVYIYDRPIINGNTYSYTLRFYDDGTVICYTNTAGYAKDGSFPSASKLQKGAGLPYDYDDTYTLDGSSITFTDAFENGTIDYTGTVDSDQQITLAWHSNVNGNSGSDEVYIFYPSSNIPGWN